MAEIKQRSKCKKCGIRFNFKTSASTENFDEQQDIFNAFESFEKVIYGIHRKYCEGKK